MKLTLVHILLTTFGKLTITGLIGRINEVKLKRIVSIGISECPFVAESIQCINGRNSAAIILTR